MCFPLALSLPLIHHYLICSSAPLGRGYPPPGVCLLTIVLGTVNDAHTALWAVVGEQQDVKEVLLCWVALQDLLVDILHCLGGTDETLLQGA